jgi:hypothetical protein
LVQANNGNDCQSKDQQQLLLVVITLLPVLALLLLLLLLLLYGRCCEMRYCPGEPVPSHSTG